LIDVKTEQTFYTKPGYYSSNEMQLVFSDEFDTDGRTFYPGDDPYWEAVDLHYWEVSAFMSPKMVPNRAFSDQ
jgi:beta-glucan synthesis-associated protein KRE6